jgi:hypothetical protein
MLLGMFDMLGWRHWLTGWQQYGWCGNDAAYVVAKTSYYVSLTVR